jgi:predicted extracellular nuclease
VLISEVFTGSEASGEDEFIELYNPGQQSIDLTGWYINKKTASGKEDNLVARARFQNKNISPGQYFLLVHDGSSFGGGAPDLIWAKSNTLAAKNNTIILYNASAVKVDESSWAEIPKGGSYARISLMEGGPFMSVVNPTPKE